jgi:type IX secretion system PorP/SprF family membrane protein
MKMKRTLLSLFAAGTAVLLHAQQLPHFSQYMLNAYAENPAIGGTNPYFEASSISRYQWIGVTDAPRTYQLCVNGPLENRHFGVGGQLFTDIVGPTRRTGCYISYSYHASITDKIKLSLGLQGGILQFLVDGSKINLRDPDNVISTGLQSVIMPEFGFGAYLHSKDAKWYVGISIPELVQGKLKFFDYMNNPQSVVVRHYILTAGYKYTLNESFVLQPTAIVRYLDPVPVQFDLGIRAIYREKVWLGIAFRNNDAWVGMIGYTFRENLSFGYAYDVSTSNIRNYSTGSHEIFLSIRFHRSPEKVIPPKI